MKHFGFISALLLSCTLFAQQAYNITAPYDPATVKVAEDQRGEVIKFMMQESPRYPGTEREILVYIPQQYQSKICSNHRCSTPFLYLLHITSRKNDFQQMEDFLQNLYT